MKYLAASLLAIVCHVHASGLDLGSRVQPLPESNRFAEDGYFV